MRLWPRGQRICKSYDHASITLNKAGRIGTELLFARMAKVGLARDVWRIVSEGEPSWFVPCWSSLQSSQHIVKFDQDIAASSGANTPANTGRDNKSRNAVTNTDHTNKGNLCMVIPGPRMLKIDRGQSMLPSEPYMTIFCHTALTQKTSIAEIIVSGAPLGMCYLIDA